MSKEKDKIFRTLEHIAITFDKLGYSPTIPIFKGHQDFEWLFKLELDTIKSLCNQQDQRIKELEEQRNEERCKLQQVYSRLGVEAFGEDIHEQALKELGKVIPKFNIRQEVWIEWRGKIINVTVESIHIYIGEIIEYNLKSDRYFIPRWEDEVFYTKEEAQEKLKEIMKDEHKRNDTKRN